MTLRRIPLGTTKDRKRQINEGERKLAKRLDGIRRPGSGSFDGYKGDVATDEFLIDQKKTEAGSYRIQGSVLNKITFEARQANLTPAIVLELVTAKTTPSEWAIIPLDVFEQIKDLRNALKAYQEKEGKDSGNFRSLARDSGSPGTVSDAGSPEGKTEEVEEDEIVTSSNEERKDRKRGDVIPGKTGIRFSF